MSETDALRQVLAANPTDREALLTLGGQLQLAGDYAGALTIADAALAVRPGCAEAWLVRGDALLNSGRPEDALAAYRRAARGRETAFDAHLRMGIAQGDVGRTAAAMKAFAEALAIQPGAPVVRYRRGVLRLKHHDFAAGWDDYEARWDWDRFVEASRGYVPPQLVSRLLRWPTPADLAGKRVLLIAEQAIGDQMMFASMVPDLLAVAREVTCICEPRLIGLFTRSFPAMTVLSPFAAQIAEDAVEVVLAMGSLGHAFRRSAADFPGRPYLRADPAAVDAWRTRLGPARLRVGVSWRGGVGSTRRDARSMPLSALAPILDLPDRQFVSLQYGDVAAEIAAFNAGRDNPLIAVAPEELADFDAAAALTRALDVVVSVQTAQVHLTGALGVPCLTMVPANAEWRYGAAGEAMPWYGSVRLVRQSEVGDWASVVETVRQALLGEGREFR